MFDLHFLVFVGKLRALFVQRWGGINEGCGSHPRGPRDHERGIATPRSVVSLKVARGPAASDITTRFCFYYASSDIFSSRLSNHWLKLRSRGKESLPLFAANAAADTSSLLSFSLPISFPAFFPSCAICSVGRSRRALLFRAEKSNAPFCL